MTSTTSSNNGFNHNEDIMPQSAGNTFNAQPDINKIGFSALFRWALKRNRSLITVYSIILGIIGPILNLYIYSVNTNGESGVLVVTLVIYVAVAALFTLISSLKTFSFLHNKRSVDMFGALPCSRVTLFLSHLVAGGLSVIVPYIAFAFISMAISARSAESVKFGLTGILFTVIMIAASYIFTTLMAYCCGTVVDTIIATIAVNGIWVGAIALFYALTVEIIPGLLFDSILSSPILVALAPYGFGYMGMYAHFSGGVPFYLGTLAWYLLYTAAVFFAALTLAKKRKAETSQNGFAVKWLPIMIEAGASIVAGALFGYIFAATSDGGFSNMFVYAVWYIIIGFVAFFILHIIFARGVKGKKLKSVIIYSATTAVSLLIVFVMCFGFGIDTYVPSPNSVKSVSLTYGGVEFTEPETIKLITDIHKAVTEGIRNENDYPYYLGEKYDRTYNDSFEMSTEYSNDAIEFNDYDYSKSEEELVKYRYLNYFDFNFEYKMKSGIKVCRTYYIAASDDGYDRDKINDLCKQLFNTEEYKRKTADFVFDSKKQSNVKISSVDLEKYVYRSTGSYSSYPYGDTSEYSGNSSYVDSYEYSSNGSITLPVDEKFLNGLYAALQKDILADTEFIPKDVYDYSNFNDILGSEYYTLRFNTKEKNSYTYGTNSSYEYELCSVMVKTSYKNTLDYLKNNNLDIVNNFNYTTLYGTLYEEEFMPFLETGDYGNLYHILYDAYPTWADAVCYYLKDAYPGNDYNWRNFQSELYDSLTEESLRLYNEMQVANGNSSLSMYSRYIPTEEEANSLIEALQTYTAEFIAKKFDVELSEDLDSDTDSKDTGSDKNSGSGTQSNSSDKETESKAQSNKTDKKADSDTQSKTGDKDSDADTQSQSSKSESGGKSLKTEALANV